MIKENILICGLPNTVLRIFIENLKDKYNIFFISYSKKLQYLKIKEILGKKTFLVDFESSGSLRKMCTMFRLISTSFKIASKKKTQIFLAYHNHFIKNGMIMLMMKWCFPKIKRIYFPYDVASYAFPKELKYQYIGNGKAKGMFSLYMDRICFEKCDKIITKGFESELIYLKGIYRIHGKPHFAFNFLIEQRDIINKEAYKLNHDKIHLVFIGSLAGDSKACLDNVEVFKELLEDKRIFIHVYSHNLEVIDKLKNRKNLIIHDYIAEHDKLIREISKYDFAINLYKHHEEGFIHVKVSSAVKIYDYLAAGLPIITDSEHEYVANMIKVNNFGIVVPYSEMKNIVGYIEKCNYDSLISSVKKNRERYFVEKHIKKLMEFIEGNANKKNKK